MQLNYDVIIKSLDYLNDLNCFLALEIIIFGLVK